MSRILDSLRKAEQERQALPPEGTEASPAGGRRRPERGYFWLSLALLAVAGAVIVGGFLWLQQRLYGVTPREWLAGWLPQALVDLLGR